MNGEYEAQGGEKVYCTSNISNVIFNFFNPVRVSSRQKGRPAMWRLERNEDSLDLCGFFFFFLRGLHAVCELEVELEVETEG